MRKIYGNEFLLSTLGSMAVNRRSAHSVIFFGEKGSGRKLMADYYTAQLLCESPHPDGTPCGECSACRTVNSHSNPDVLYVPTEGKLEGYSANTARAVIKDAHIKPNNHTGKKVYIFRDCRNMSAVTQNMLLKIIEEPPDHAYFIFTADSRYEFLPTIISRCLCFGVSACTEEEAEISLKESGFSPAEIHDAINCFHGNIGMCTSYIVDEGLRKQVDLTKRITESIINKDEYGLNAAFYSVGGSRNDIKDILSMIDKLVRDAAMLSRDSKARTVGVFREGAQRLAEVLTAYRAVKIHEVIEKAREAVDANVSAPLVLAALCAQIMEITA